MAAWYSLTPYAITNENHVPKLYPSTGPFTGARALHAYVYGEDRMVAFCHHNHRLASTARACARRLLRTVTGGTKPGTEWVRGKRQPVRPSK